MKTCKSCPQPARPCSSLCSTCWQKSPAGYGDDYYEMVGRHIEQADREAAAKEVLPFDGDVHDDDYASPEMYQAQDEQLGKASGL